MRANMIVNCAFSLGPLPKVGAIRAMRSSRRPIVCTATLLVSIAIGQMSAQQPILCDKSTTDAHACTLTLFDRPANWMGKIGVGRPTDGPNVTPASDRKLVWAINSPASKILYSGTVISAPFIPFDFQKCISYDWKVVLLSAESSNVIMYGPADIAAFCDSDNDHTGAVLLVVPVSVIWAQVFHYTGNPLDPLRKPPGKVPPPTGGFYCGAPAPSADPQDPTSLPVPLLDSLDHPNGNKTRPGGIKPCDVYAHLQVYSSPLGSAYNRLTQPGTSQGTISFIPAIGKVPSGPLPSDKKPNEVLSFDVQLYPSGLWGPGWIGMPIVFEKANTATANLDSLSVALSYDIPFARSTHYESDAKGSGNFTIRPPDFRIQYGPELATATPHDINLVASATLRLPLAVDFHAQPSALTIFPVVGIEGGNHIHTHEIEDRWEDDDILRKVVGFDSSLRIPFILTHQFLGDKPMTIDFDWRTRYLSYPEPFTDYVRKQQRSYWRGSFIVPASTYVQFKVTVQHGGLPPDFDYLGYSVNLGFTFLNPGYSEH